MAPSRRRFLRNLAAGAAVFAVPTVAAARSGAEGACLRFKTLAIQDRDMGQEAFRLLVPADWHGSGGVLWRMHPQLPATGWVKATAPDGVTAVQLYPNVPFVDGVREAMDRMARSAGLPSGGGAIYFPEGANYVGNEVRRLIASPAGYVAKVLVPRLRSDLHGARVVDEQELPELARASSYLAEPAPGVDVRTRAGRVRLAYSLNGREVREDFFVLLVTLRMLGMTYWGTELASSVRAERGGLDEAEKVQQTMLRSLRIDLNWYSRERQVAAVVTDIYNRQIETARRVSEIIARTNNEITATIRRSYEQRQAALDRTNAAWSRSMRGVDLYVSPSTGRRVELPAGYRTAWANGAGEYVVSNDPFFDPNRTLNGTWRRLEPGR